jgi:hypothetical protein
VFTFKDTLKNCLIDQACFSVSSLATPCNPPRQSVRSFITKDPFFSCVLFQRYGNRKLTINIKKYLNRARGCKEVTMSLQQFNENAKGYLAGTAMLAATALPLSAQADASKYPTKTPQEVSEMTNQDDCSRGLVGAFYIPSNYKNTRALEATVRIVGEDRLAIIGGSKYNYITSYYCAGRGLETFADTPQASLTAAHQLRGTINAGDGEIEEQSEIPFNQRYNTSVLETVNKRYPGSKLKEQVVPHLLTPSL